MSESDLQSYLLDTVEILDLPDGDAVVYPTGALIGRSYRIPGAKAAEFYHWRLTEISPPPIRVWLSRGVVIAGLAAAVLGGRFFAAAIPGIDFIVVAAVLAVLTIIATTTARRRFLSAFPLAQRFRDTERYRRLIQAYVCHPAFAFWKCAVFSTGFAIATIALAAVLARTATSLPVQNMATLAGAALLLFALATLTAVPGWIAMSHLTFWRRTGRMPQLEDAQTLA